MTATAAHLSTLPDSELHKISLLKGRRGNATAEALKAQRILCERSGGGYRNDRPQTASDDYCYGEPQKFTKKFR